MIKNISIKNFLGIQRYDLGFCSDGSLAELKNTPFSSLMNRFTKSTQQQEINSKINQYTLKELNDLDSNVKGEFLVF